MYIPENNFDGQLAQILTLDLPGEAGRMTSLALGDALPMTPDWLFRRIREEEGLA